MYIMLYILYILYIICMYYTYIYTHIHTITGKDRSAMFIF